MGSAVSAVTGAIGDIVSPIANIVGGTVGSVASPILGSAGSAVGSALGGLAQGIIQAIPTVPIANQSNVQNQINANANNAQTFANQQAGQQVAGNQLLNNASNQIFGNSQNAIQQAQGNINQAQGAVNNAQQVNQGPNSNVNSAIGLVGQTAAGGGAAQQAANATLQAGTNAAIAQQQAAANSGNLSQMIGGQRTAMQNAATIQEQNALNAAQLQAGLATTAQGQYTGAAAQQAGQAAQNAGLQQQQTTQQQAQTTAQQNQAAQLTGLGQAYNNQATTYGGLANTAQGNALTGQTNALGIQQTALGQSGQNAALGVGGVLNAAGAVGAAGLTSDENQKTDIEYANGPDSGQPFYSMSPNQGPNTLEGPSFQNQQQNSQPSFLQAQGNQQQFKQNLQSQGVMDENGNINPNLTPEQQQFQGTIMNAYSGFGPGGEAPSINDTNTSVTKAKVPLTPVQAQFIHDAGQSFSGLGKNPMAQWQGIPLSSDKNVKENIQNQDKVKSFLDAIEPVTFDYKNPDGQNGKTPGKHLGIIAQQIEKAPFGKSMVMDTPNGKAIDIPSAVGTLLGSAAELNDRISSLEDLFKSKKASKEKK
jgi:hypothetical protein